MSVNTMVRPLISNSLRYVYRTVYRTVYSKREFILSAALSANDRQVHIFGSYSRENLSCITIFRFPMGVKMIKYDKANIELIFINRIVQVILLVFRI